MKAFSDTVKLYLNNSYKTGTPIFEGSLAALLQTFDKDRVTKLSNLSVGPKLASYRKITNDVHLAALGTSARNEHLARAMSGSIRN